MKGANVQLVGRHISTDPAFCHGKHTFRDTHSRVWQALVIVAVGTAWVTIVEDWGGRR